MANQTANLAKGTLVLTIAALLVKVLSALYRIPFQNIVGDVGFYIYQQVYPFYGVAVILCTYGFPVVISKLYAEQKLHNDGQSLKLLMKATVIVLCLLGGGLFLFFYFFAEQIAIVMHDAELAQLIKAISFIFLIFPIVAALRGFFQGESNMVPTAVSQVGEQLVRVCTIVIVAVILINKNYSLYEIGAGAMYSSLAGFLISALILNFFAMRNGQLSSVIFVKVDKSEQRRAELKKFIRQIFFQGIAVCISGMLLIFIQLADSLNLYSLLVNSGFDRTVAKSLKGVYDRGQPLIQLGTVVATSIGLAIIPFIARAKMRQEQAALARLIKLTVRVSITVSVAASVGLASIIVPTNIMLFKNSAGSNVLIALSFIILLSSVIIVIVALLQGLGQITFPAITIFMSLILKYCLNIILVTKFGLIGGAYASLISLLAITVILVVKLKRLTTLSLIDWQFIVQLSKATVSLAVFLAVYIRGTNFLYDIIQSTRTAASMQSLSAVLLGGLLFIFIILKSSVFEKAHIKLLPFGERLIKIFKVE